MIFATKPFYIFLAIVLLAYYLLPTRQLKYRTLLLASWIFYGWLSPQYLWVIGLVTLVDYFAGLQIERARSEAARGGWLILSVVSNLGLLFSFKYTVFVYDTGLSLAELCGYSLPARTWDILLPLGISFHTFQGISYTVDVYRRQIRAVPGLIDYAMFVTFFPQLAAGPIVRASEFLPQMVVPPRASRQQIADGIWLFASGLFKKLVIADNLDTLIVTPVFTDPQAYSEVVQRWAALAWAVQIYCDFSGYTDLARACGKWFGFELPENFRLPYLATSITDFWRRWHLSLSTWLRDYLYFPLGGSKGHVLRTYFNLLVLFVLCGLWHGAAWNWFVYGLFNGFLMCVHRIYDQALKGYPWLDSYRASIPWVLVAWLVTALQFLIGLILIRMTSWENGWRMMQSLVTLEWPVSGTESVPATVGLLLFLGILGHLVGLVWALLGRKPVPTPDAIRMPFAAGLLVATVLFHPGVTKTFIYIHF